MQETWQGLSSAMTLHPAPNADFTHLSHSDQAQKGPEAARIFLLLITVFTLSFGTDFYFLSVILKPA